MRKLLFVVLVFGITLSAANFKLYLKDGGFQLVREYTVEGDRVKYYSVDRSDWEEIPADLVDLKRTDAEAGARKSALATSRKRTKRRRPRRAKSVRRSSKFRATPARTGSKMASSAYSRPRKLPCITRRAAIVLQRCRRYR